MLLTIENHAPELTQYYNKLHEFVKQFYPQEIDNQEYFTLLRKELSQEMEHWHLENFLERHLTNPEITFTELAIGMVAQNYALGYQQGHQDSLNKTIQKQPYLRHRAKYDYNRLQKRQDNSILGDVMLCAQECAHKLTNELQTIDELTRKTIHLHNQDYDNNAAALYSLAINLVYGYNLGYLVGSQQKS